MNLERRRHYLQALGIDVWVSRTAAPRVADSADEMALIQPVAASGGESAGPSIRPVPPRAPVAPPVASQRPSARAPAPAAAAKPDAVPDLPPVVPAADWAGLREQVLGCQHCKLCETRTQAVFGVGQTNAPLLIVGEGPGADEDRVGEPFVGAAGKLLDQMLGAIGRSRQTDVYIANVVKCRPPGNRDPLEAEAEACRPYLARQIELLQPRLILALGRVAAQRLLGTTEPLARLRGQVHEYAPTATPVRVTYHPAYLLRSPREKAKSWADLKQVRQQLASTP